MATNMVNLPTANTTIEGNPCKPIDATVPAFANPDRVLDFTITTLSTVYLGWDDLKKDADDYKSNKVYFARSGNVAIISNTEKKIRRVERFGITIQLSEQEKRNSRAKRIEGDAYVAEPSFSVGKSPSQNGRQYSERTSGAAGLGEGTPKSERSDEKYCDDIFGETPAGVHKFGKGDGLSIVRSGLYDNWDDVDGYYGYRFGELLDGRYEIVAVHGKSVFSTVVRAKDLKVGAGEPEEVPIKIIRNNETIGHLVRSHDWGFDRPRNWMNLELDVSYTWQAISSIDVIASLLSGRLVRERIGPAMLSAVQSQMGVVKATFEEAQNIFDTGGAKGLTRDTVEKIPKIKITSNNNVDASGEKVACSVCLQDFQICDTVRSLPHCHHMFRQDCIDNWLLKHDSYPLYRRDL